MTDTAPTTEAVAQTLQDYLRVADETGELRGTELAFSPNGEVWFDVVIEDEPPAVAKATVRRTFPDGEKVTTVVNAVWSESLPPEGEWRELWLAKPHALFGAFATRAALRRAFAKALGDRREPDEQHTAPAPADAPRTPATVFDPAAADAEWVPRIEAATTVAEVDSIRDEIRDSKQPRTQGQTNALRRRRRELETDPSPTAAPTEAEWLERIATAESPDAVDSIRQSLLSEGAVPPALHQAIKVRRRELATAAPLTAGAAALGDAVAQARAKGRPTPLSVQAATRGAVH